MADSSRDPPVCLTFGAPGRLESPSGGESDVGAGGGSPQERKPGKAGFRPLEGSSGSGPRSGVYNFVQETARVDFQNPPMRSLPSGFAGTALRRVSEGSPRHEPRESLNA